MRDKASYFYLFSLLSVIFISCSSLQSSVKEPSVLPGSDDGDYDIRYYKHPSYASSEDRFIFLDKDLLRGEALSDKNYGYYYKVFYSEDDTSLVKQVNEYRHHQLISSVYYKYNDKLEKLESRHYLENGRLFIVGLYKSGVLYKRRQLTSLGHVRYVSLIKFVAKGMTEVWYTPSGQMSYVVHYDKKMRVVRYAYYKGGLVDLFIDSRYGKNSVLVRQDYYTKNSKRLKFVKYYYDSKGYLKQSKTYKSSSLISVTNFDLKSRETRIENYDKQGGLLSYSDISYDGDIKEARWFDKASFMTKMLQHNKDDELIYYVEYSRGRREIKLIKNHFENGIKLRSELYSYGLLKSRSFFGAGGNLAKEELFRKGNLLSYSTFVYNDKGQLTKKESFSSQGYFLSSSTYSYNKLGLMLMEKLSSDKGLAGVRVFEYNKRSSLSSIKIFDDKNRLVRREFLDSRGRVYKLENGLGGILDNVVKYRFSGSGSAVSQEEHYDSYGNLIRVLTFVYNNDGSISREDGFDGKKQYLGSVLYEYNESGILFRQLMLNHIKEPYEAVYFDLETGSVKRREKYKSGNN